MKKKKRVDKKNKKIITIIVFAFLKATMILSILIRDIIFFRKFSLCSKNFNA